MEMAVDSWSWSCLLEVVEVYNEGRRASMGRVPSQVTRRGRISVLGAGYLLEDIALGKRSN